MAWPCFDAMAQAAPDPVFYLVLECYKATLNILPFETASLFCDGRTLDSRARLQHEPVDQNLSGNVTFPENSYSSSRNMTVFENSKRQM